MLRQRAHPLAPMIGAEIAAQLLRRTSPLTDVNDTHPMIGTGSAVNPNPGPDLALDVVGLVLVHGTTGLVQGTDVPGADREVDGADLGPDVVRLAARITVIGAAAALEAHPVRIAAGTLEVYPDAAAGRSPELLLGTDHHLLALPRTRAVPFKGSGHRGPMRRHRSSRDYLL